MMKAKAIVASLFAISACTVAVAGESINYKVDGAEFEGYFAKASGPSKGLVFVIHDWDGLGGYEQKRADMLAQMGYDAFAVDLFGKGNRPATNEARMAETGKLYKDRDKMRSLLLGGLAEAQKLSQGNIVVMGYCFGGTATLELARSGKAGKVKGYTSFHGGLSTPAGQSYPKDTPPIFVAHGGADTLIKMSEVAALAEELEKTGVKYDIEVYSGAPHAFTVFGAPVYREHADKKSWATFQEFLKTALGG
jgi:dienelactone hydrolase